MDVQSYRRDHPPSLKLRRDGASQAEDLAKRMPRHSHAKARSATANEGGPKNLGKIKKFNLPHFFLYFLLRLSFEGQVVSSSFRTIVYQSVHSGDFKLSLPRLKENEFEYYSFPLLLGVVAFSSRHHHLPKR